MKHLQSLTKASGRSIVALWILLLLGMATALRRSPLLTDHPRRAEGWEGALGAPPYVFVPIVSTMILTLVLTVRWWKGRSHFD